MRCGDSAGGIPLNRDAIPFKNICLEVHDCVTHVLSGKKTHSCRVEGTDPNKKGHSEGGQVE